MSIFFLLLIPLAIAAIGFFAGKGKIDPRELGIQVAVVLIAVLVPYAIALHGKTSDTEIWNGVVASKDFYSVSCCHPYCCQTCQSCTTDSKGNTTCSSYCCQTCYEHSHDDEWDAMSSNNENIYHNGCNAPGYAAPARWTAIKIGEPTAVEHDYSNYIKGSPDTLLRRTGASDTYGKFVPDYPRVYDLYRADRFLVVGAMVPNRAPLNQRLSEINAKLGRQKKVNIDVIVTAVADERYLEAVREKWLGGKINDVVVVVGVDGYSLKIAWAGVISWTHNETLKVDLRNQILDMNVLDGSKLLDIIEQEVVVKYDHVRISEFEYLNASITPSMTFKVWLGVIAILLSLGLEIFFWLQDPFDNGFRSSYRRRSF